jgi:hypothetical protein
VRTLAPLLVMPQKLEAAGFMTRGDLENIGPIDLARGACAAPEAAALTRRPWQSRVHVCMSAKRLYAPVLPRHAEAELTHEEALSVLRESSSRFVAQGSTMPGALALAVATC